MPTIQLSHGIPANVFNAVAMPADGTSSDLVAIQRGSGEGPRDVAWYTFFDAPPTTFAVEIQESHDGVQFYVRDGGSNVNGDSKVLRGVVAKFLKMVIVSSTSGSLITGGFSC